MHQLLVTANVVPSSPILVTQIMEALQSSDTSVLTRAIWRYIPEDGILHGQRHENLKPYTLPETLPFYFSHLYREIRTAKSI
jgi:hypothetical protein